MTYTEVEDAVYAWVSSIIDSNTVIFFNEDGPRPTLPYITINLFAFTKVGYAYHQFPIPDTGIKKIKYDEPFTVSLQGYGKNSQNLLQELKDSLQKDVVINALDSNGLAVLDENFPVNDISGLIDSTIEKRYSYDILMGFAQELSEEVGYIEDVDITKVYLPSS